MPGMVKKMSKTIKLLGIQVELEHVEKNSVQGWVNLNALTKKEPRKSEITNRGYETWNGDSAFMLSMIKLMALEHATKIMRARGKISDKVSIVADRPDDFYYRWERDEETFMVCAHESGFAPNNREVVIYVYNDGTILPCFEEGTYSRMIRDWRESLYR